ncbi:hypothetical protein [Pedobacter xixiisoli]|nr:hypothetical protein [Pedobacter xixiisoli]
MKMIPLTLKFPKLIDYALALAISSIPGFAEADAETRSLYQSAAKHFIASELKSKRRLIDQHLKSAARIMPTHNATAARASGFVRSHLHTN